jgi:hypothetical protein
VDPANVDPERLVFTKKSGKPVGEFRKRWPAACRAAGIDDRVIAKANRSVKMIGRRLAGLTFTISGRRPCGDWSRRQVLRASRHDDDGRQRPAGSITPSAISASRVCGPRVIGKMISFPLSCCRGRCASGARVPL